MPGPWQIKMGGGGSWPQTTEGFAGRNRKGTGMGVLQEQRAGENCGRTEKVCQQKGCLSSQGGEQTREQGRSACAVALGNRKA